MEQFSLEKYLENPSRKVVTRSGNPVRILCTDCGVMMSHPILTEICSGKAKVLEYHYIDGTTQNKNNDLFFADEEKLNSIIDELKSYIEKTPKEQVEKDWKEIQDWYTQHFTNEKHNEEEELTEFEKAVQNILNEPHFQDIEAVKQFSKALLDIARRELKNNDWRQSLRSYKDAYEQGEQDALKDLPKWKDVSEKNGAGTKDYKIVGYYLVKGNYAIYLEDLEKLPKEE